MNLKRLASMLVLKFLTVFAFSQNPGGVSTDLRLWLKANTDVYRDAGSNLATDGQGVEQWHDQSTTNDASQTSVGLQPIYRNNTADNINFNSVLDFDGAGDRLDGAAGAYSGTYYIIFRNDLTIDNSTTASAFVLGMTPDATVVDDLGGFAIGSFEGDLTDEVLGHAADQFQSAFTSSSTSYAAGSTFLIRVQENLFMDGIEIFLLGEQLTDTETGTYESINGGAYVVGDEALGGAFLANSFNGTIAEIITYETRNDVAESERIESYLAVKYGMTLQVPAFDWIASDGTTGFWDSGTNSSFNNDVFGVGRDDNSALGQIISKSVNSDAIVSVLMEGESSDDSNTPANLTFVDVADLEFLMIGNNDGAATWTSTGAPSRFQILSREWFVEETGDIGTVQLDFDVADTDFDVPALLAGDSYYIVIDSDVDGDFSDETPTVLSDQGGNIWRATGIDFNNGEKFTLAKGNSPGGVSADLSLWLRADEDVFSDAGITFATDGDGVEQWNDLGSGNNASQSTGTEQPTYRDNDTDNINFNPILEFDGTDDLMDGSAGFHTSNYYIVINPDFTISRNLNAGGQANAVLSWDCSGCVNDFGNLGFGDMTGSIGTPTPGEVITHSVGGWRSALTGTSNYPSGEPLILAIREGSSLSELSINGFEITEQTVSSFETVTNVGYRLGYQLTSNGGFLESYFTGKIGELVVYSSEFASVEDSNEDNQIQSYLAAKYGITLDQTVPEDYTASDGTTEMWNKDATDASTFNHDITVVGRDDDSGLIQPKSRSVNADAIVTMELIGESEGSYVDLDNLEFLAWANDDDDDGSIETIQTGSPAGVENMFDRTWKVQEVGEPGNISLTVDFSGISFPTGSEYYLITDTDTDFTDASTLVETSITNGNVTFNISENVLEDATFFTFGFTGGAGPGGVAVNLNIWLKANAEVFTDAGATDALDGELVQQWNDQAFGFDASQTTVANRPTYLDNDTDNVNFNPVLDFDGTDDFIDGTEGFYSNNYYVVVTPDNEIDRDYDAGPIGGGGEAILSFDCNGCGNDFANLGFSDMTGAIDNPPGEIITHSVDNWRSAQTGTSVYPQELPLLIGIREDASGSTSELSVNGLEVTETTAGTFEQISNAGYRIGYMLTGTGAFLENYLEGKISEFISYSADFVNAEDSEEDARIQSYLAIKYGVSLDQSSGQNYVASDNTTTIWNSTTAAGYHNNITVIGRDSGSDLLQIKSKSQASGGVVTIEARDEAEGSLVDLDDIEFLSWSNDGASGTTQTGLPSSVTEMLQRIWFVQETGDDTNEVGDLNITFDISGLGISAGDYFLIYDQTDTDFSDASTIAATSSVSGSTVTFDAIGEDVLESATYFTLGVFVTTPGGASTGISAWFDANQGVTSSGVDVSEWTDISGNGNNATQVTADNQPDLVANALNFNSAIDFDGDNSDPADGDFLDGISGGAYSDACYMVFQNDLGFDNLGDPGSGFFPLGMTPGTGTAAYGGLGLGYIEDNPTFSTISHLVSDTYGVSENNTMSVVDYPAGTTFLLAVRDNDPSTPTASEIFLNGDQINSANYGTFTSISDQNFRIGDEPSGSTIADLSFNGIIAEIIMFSAGTTTSEHAQIQSYLALKYGITLDQSTAQDYMASDGSTRIWDKDATDASTYDNDIFGIGLDLSSGLDQPKSMSINNDGIITIANSDFDSPVSIGTDLTFLTIGNDDAVLTETTSDVPTNVTDRITREWMSQVEGDALLIDMEFDVSSSSLTGKVLEDFILIVDRRTGTGTIGDFTDGTIATFLPASFTSDLVRFEGVSLEDGDIFSLGTARSVVPAPGGVATNLNIWLKADKDVSLTGVEVTSWDDQTSNNVDLTPPAAANRPRLSATFMNGNPAVRFNSSTGTDDLLSNTSVTTFPTSALTNFLVINREEDLTDNNEGLIDFYTGADPDEYVVSNLNVDLTVSLNDEVQSSNPDADFDDGVSHIVGVQWEGLGGTASYYKDGLSLGVTNNYNSTVTLDATGQLALGNQSSSGPVYDGGDAFIGAISEVVLYSSDLVAGDQDRVNSYLAIKYGISLDLSGGDNYVASTTTPIWDNTNGGGSYNNEIIGIGRDDASALNQLVSSNSADMLILSTPSISTDLNFLLVGNDNGTLSNINDSDLPGGGVQGRLNRIWFAEETGDITGNLIFDLSNFTNLREQDLVLLLDDNGEFSDAASYTTGRFFDASNDSLVFDLPNFSSTPYFTLGTLNGTETPLPVELVSFEGQRRKNDVKLGWSTSSELNNSHFVIQRSTDGRSWSEIGNVKGNGNSNEFLEYGFVDKNPFTSACYYRLKQVDLDGAFEYSQVVYIDQAESRLDQIFLYPNPTNGIVNIASPVNNNTVVVYDLSGTVKSISIIEGNNFNVDLSEFESGTYIIVIQNEEAYRSIPIIKK